MGGPVVTCGDWGSTRLMQRILDEQGYIVLGHDVEMVVGGVWHGHGPIFGLELEDQPQLGVIGVATKDDLTRQVRRYYPPVGAISIWNYYYKVTAE